MQRFCLEYVTVNDGSIVFKYVGCKKNFKKEFDEDLAKRFENTYRLPDGDTNRFTLML